MISTHPTNLTRPWVPFPAHLEPDPPVRVLSGTFQSRPPRPADSTLLDLGHPNPASRFTGTGSLAFHDSPCENHGQEPVPATTRSIDKEPEAF